MSLDEQEYIAIAHSDHLFRFPIRSEKVEQVITLLGLAPGDRVLDVGCHKAEMLIRIAGYCQVAGIGLESSQYLIDAAQEQLANRAPGADIVLHHGAIESYTGEPTSFDCVICTNMSDAFDSDADAISVLRKWVNSDGFLLFGQSYWRGSPDSAPPDEGDFAAIIQLGEAQGLIPLYATSSNQDDIDHYHWLQVNAVERYVYENPSASNREALLDKSRNERSDYLKKRETLGFGLYLFQAP